MFNRREIKNNFSNAASGYDFHAGLQQKIREDALQLAAEYFLQGETILDLGCGTAELSKNSPQNLGVISLDISFGMCAVARRKGALVINAAADALPLQNESVDGVFSSLMLQWVEKPEIVIKEILRVLKPDGVAVLTTFVHGTLRELAAAFAAIDSNTHISEFITSEQLLLRAAHSGATILEFSDEVYEEKVENALALMRSIKKIGAVNKNVGRKKGMMTRAQLARLEAAYTKNNEQNIASWQVLTVVLGKS
jgi:malonyl-CoA O-methyltransferase